MARSATVALGLFLGALSTAAPGLTQTALGTLRGVALDQQGGVLPGVTITVRQVETNTVQTTVTGAEGQYFLPNQGSLQSTSFGLPLTEGPKRRQQLGFRFDF